MGTGSKREPPGEGTDERVRMEARKGQIPHRWQAKPCAHLALPPSLGLSPISQTPKSVAGEGGGRDPRDSHLVIQNVTETQRAAGTVH